MTILVVFATNSGGTAAAATIIAHTLSDKGHTVTIKEAKDTQPDDLRAALCIILGSPSWDYLGLEGQPLPEIMECINRCKDVTLVGKPCAVFGLGDSSYTYFCGAVTYLESFVKRIKGNLVVPSLKVDGFYMRSEAGKSITKWAEELAEKLIVETRRT